MDPQSPSPSDSALADLEHREDPYNVTQASHIYFLPNLMTAGNLFCGFMAVIYCIHARLAESVPSLLYQGTSAVDHYRYAVYFIFGALRSMRWTAAWHAWEVANRCSAPSSTRLPMSYLSAWPRP